MATAEEDKFKEVHSSLTVSTTPRRPHFGVNLKNGANCTRHGCQRAVRKAQEGTVWVFGVDHISVPPGNPTALIPRSIVTIQPYKFPRFAKDQKCFSSVVVQQASQRHRGCTRAGRLGSASKEKTTEDTWSHSWGSSRGNYTSNQLLFLLLLTLARERTPEGQRGAAKWCLLDHLILHSSTNIEMQCCYAEQVTAALERNPPHRTLCFLLVCVPYCFSLQPPSENQGKNQNENLVLLNC